MYNPKQMYVVKFEDNYADEYDLDGAIVLPGAMLEEFLQKAQSYLKNETLEICIGTNEYLEYSDYPSFAKCIRFQQISDDEARALEMICPTIMGSTIYSAVMEAGE